MKNLNHLRIEAGYSIADLARMMDVKTEIVCRWLCGSNYPDPAQIDRLAHIFDIAPQSLIASPSKPPRRSDKLRGKISNVGDTLHRKRARSL